jgi:hypothetical protein
MPDVELRADYDRDGRLSGSAAEYAARASGPGAIIGVNVDRDGRVLPAAARVGSAVVLDYARPTKDGHDTDPVPLGIIVSPRAITAFASLTLRISGENAAAVGLLDARSRVLTPARTVAGGMEYPLPLAPGRHAFSLEARRVPGPPPGTQEGAITVRVIGRDAAGTETAIDEGRFELARFLVLDEIAPARQVYICSVPDNQPSVSDVREGLTGLSPAVELRIVAPEDSRGDGWLQDQFQLGYLVSPAGTMRAVLHLPRLRKNAQIGPDQRNLAELVRTHFPSSNLGLIDDYWQRRVPIPDAGGPVPVTFEVSEEAFRVMRRVIVAEDFLRESLARLCAAAVQLQVTPTPAECQNLPPRMTTLPTIRTQLPELLRRVEKVVKRLLPVAVGKESGLRAVLGRSQALVRQLDQQLAVSGTGTGETFALALSSRTFRMSGSDLNDLFETVSRMHDSLVYGGNIEASPPLASHPFGKVVIGESDERQMDPELRRLFDGNAAVQPVVTVDTAWLGVGHVDELIAFLPDRAAGGRHAILRASPELALALLEAASALYKSGISPDDPDNFRNWHPFTLQRHGMGKGTHPITRMFRGKLWLHVHHRVPAQNQPNGAADPDRETGEVLSPPRIYLRMVDWFGGLLGEQLAPYFPEDEEDTHYYRAALTPWELSFFEGDTNQAIVDEKLTALDALLDEEFGDFARYQVPVLFDRAPALDVAATAAFTPNLVNLQYVNGRVLIPHPFGPRMRPADAAAVVQGVLRDQGLGGIADTVSARWLQRRGLDMTAVWVNRDLRGGVRSASFGSALDLAREFKDGFERTLAEEEIVRRIRRANRTAFDGSGDLKAGWWKVVIPENTVDLFQAYTQALLESLGLTSRWIDSWFYHVRYGEIHCGTNVLRDIPAIRPAWWTRLAAANITAPAATPTP